MKSKQTFLMLSLLLVGAGQLSAMQDQIPIPIYTSDDEYIIIRTPGSIRIDCVYDTDNNTFVFSIVGSTDTIAVSINNSSTNETFNTVFIGSGLFYVPVSGTAGNWHIVLTSGSGEVYQGECVI